MPKRGKRWIRLNKSIKLRWSMKNASIDDSDSDKEFKINSNEMEVDDKDNNINWTDNNMLNYIGDLFQICINQCNLKTLSTFTYMILKHFNLTWRHIDNFMCSIGAMRCITVNKWLKCF